MKEFQDSLTKGQQSTLVTSVGSTPGYLRLVLSGYEKVDFNLAKKLEDIIPGRITKHDLRSDVYSKQ